MRECRGKWKIVAGGMAAACAMSVALANADPGEPMPVGDMAATPTVAQGSVFDVTYFEATGLIGGQFTAKPRVTANYFPHYNRRGKWAPPWPRRANLRVDRVPKGGAEKIVCEWTRRELLYDRRGLTVAQRGDMRAAPPVPGQTTAEWLLADPGNQQDELPLSLSMISRRDMIDEPVLGGATLSAPMILTATVQSGAMALGDLGATPVWTGDRVVIEGYWFGTRRPTVWREFRDARSRVRRQRLKVLKANDPTMVDARGRFIYMNRETGVSKVVAEIPARDPNGDLFPIVVLENRAGLAVGLLEATPVTD